jgi:hypothetical protein
MDKPFVIRYTEEEQNDNDEDRGSMVNNVVSYFTNPDVEGHRKKWKRRKRPQVEREEPVDYYYI